MANELSAEQVALLSGKQIPPQLVAHLMGLDVASIHVDRPLTNMVVGYKNRAYVADAIMPVVPVAKRSDKYFEFDPAENLTILQTTLAGTRGMPNEVSSHVSAPHSYLVNDHALLYFVSADELMNADAPLRPMEIANRRLWNSLMIAREQRVSTALTTSGNYGAQTTALVGGDRWDQSTSDPVAQLFAAIKSCLVRPTHLVINEEVETYLMNHAKVLQFLLGRAASKAGPTELYPNEDMLAKLLGLEGLIVSRAKYNSAVEGHTMTQAYLWGKSAALIRVEPSPSISETAVTSYTLRFGAIETRIIPEYLHGVRGGSFVKMSHSDAETIIGAPYTSFLFTTVVS